MRVRLFKSLCITTAISAIGVGSAWRAAGFEPDTQRYFGQDMQVLTRGPVHEAFAETVTYDPEPGIVVTRPPPASIEEIPPEQRPAGDNIDWIPGYWAWDDERGDFLWVSGTWRAIPPDRQWLPGYWARTNGGFQWTSGYWADARASEIEYLPEPPATVELGPNIAPASADDSWSPGSWVWYQDRYAWRPGYWISAQPDWIWTPAHYVWAPRGYVFVDGYWDYSVERRGVLFAPVYFAPRVYIRRGLTYSPATAINLSVFSEHLFVRPQYNHYYFGDYYAATYRDAGFVASFSYHSDRRGYDPIYSHQLWQHRRDPEWGRHVEANFSYLRDHAEARPQRTLVDQIRRYASDAKSSDRRSVVATTLDRVAGTEHGRMRMQPVEKNERQRLTLRGHEIQRYRDERNARDRSGANALPAGAAREAGPVRASLRSSPISAKPTGQRGKADVPPRRPEPPKVDLKVHAKPHKTKAKKVKP